MLDFKSLSQNIKTRKHLYDCIHELLSYQIMLRQLSTFKKKIIINVDQIDRLYVIERKCIIDPDDYFRDDDINELDYLEGHREYYFIGRLCDGNIFYFVEMFAIYDYNGFRGGIFATENSHIFFQACIQNNDRLNNLNIYKIFNLMINDGYQLSSNLLKKNKDLQSLCHNIIALYELPVFELPCNLRRDISDWKIINLYNQWRKTYDDDYGWQNENDIFLNP